MMNSGPDSANPLRLESRRASGCRGLDPKIKGDSNVAVPLLRFMIFDGIIKGKRLD